MAGSSLQVEPLRPGLTFGAVITGLVLEDDGGSLIDCVDTWAALESALVEHGLICIRGQEGLSTENLVSFANHWRTEPTADGGRKLWLDEYSATSGAELTGQKERTKATGQATAPYRIDRHGVPRPDGEIRVLGNRPGRYRNRLGKEWHSDGSGVTAMLGKIIPSQEKRTTLFACGHAAFTSLPVTEQQHARQTTVVISTKYRTGQGDDADIEYGYRLSEDGLRREVAVDESKLTQEMLAFKAAAPEVRAPLVKYHGVTGKPAMHVNPMGLDHIEIAGTVIEDEESADILRQLLLPAVEPSRVYEHEWQAGDLLLFDNRRMLHSTPAYVPIGPNAEEQLIYHVSYQAAFSDAFANYTGEAGGPTSSSPSQGSVPSGSNALCVPALDMAELGKEGGLQRAAAQMDAGFSSTGFILLRNHNVDPVVTDAAFDAAKRFFALDATTKEEMDGYTLMADIMRKGVPGFLGWMKQRPVPESERVAVNNEYFSLNQHGIFTGTFHAVPNSLEEPTCTPWPDENVHPELHGFRLAITKYVTTMRRLFDRLLPIFASALDVDVDFFRDAFRMDEDSHSLVRLNHYPQVDPELETGAIGLFPHTDGDFCTILPPSAAPGLEVCLTDGRWVRPQISPDEILVNSGDMLRRWTNNRYLSALHRAACYTGIDRLSLPVFFHPRHSAIVDTLPSCVAPDEGDYYASLGALPYRTLKSKWAEGGFAPVESLEEGQIRSLRDAVSRSADTVTSLPSQSHVARDHEQRQLREFMWTGRATSPKL